MLNIGFFLSWIPEYPYDCRRILQLILLGLAVIWLLVDYPVRRAWLQFYQKLPLWTHTGIGVFFILGLVSSFLAPLPPFAFLQVGLYALLWVTSGLIAALYQLYEDRVTHFFVFLLLLMIGLYEIYLLQSDIRIQFFHTVFSGAMQTQELALVAPGFQQPRFLAQFLSWTLPLIVLPTLLYPHHSRGLKFLYLVVASLWWYAMILNHSRGLWVEWVILTVVMLVFLRSRSFSWFKAQLTAAITGGIFYGVITWLLPLSISHTPITQSFYTDAMRGQIWWYALKMAWSSPWLGVGPLHYAYYFRASPWPAHPHNGILNIAAEWGIPAILILLTLVVSAVLHWASLKSKIATKGTGKEALYVCLSAALLAGFLDSLYSGTFVMPLSQMTFVLIAGWMLGLYHAGPVVTEPPIRLHIYLIILMLGAAILVLGGVSLTVFRLHEITNNFIQQICIEQQLSCVLTPNFWVEGWIQFYINQV